jgi:hypothetical protein
MSNDSSSAAVPGHYKSFTFPQYKKPGLKVDVSTVKQNKDATSAEEAVKEIEDIAKVITQSSSSPHLSNLKDPASAFMTARDVSAYQKAFDLGVIREIKNKRVMGDGNSPREYDRDTLRSAFASAFVACPVCSIALRTNYQMEWVEDAGVFHCIRCFQDINPFDPKTEGIPENQSEFGLSAIDDHHSNPQRIQDKPFFMVSNRKYKKGGRFSELEEHRKNQQKLDELKKGKSQKKNNNLT